MEKSVLRWLPEMMAKTREEVLSETGSTVEGEPRQWAQLGERLEWIASLLFMNCVHPSQIGTSRREIVRLVRRCQSGKWDGCSAQPRTRSECTSTKLFRYRLHHCTSGHDHFHILRGDWRDDISGPFSSLKRGRISANELFRRPRSLSGVRPIDFVIAPGAQIQIDRQAFARAEEKRIQEALERFLPTETVVRALNMERRRYCRWLDFQAQRLSLEEGELVLCDFIDLSQPKPLLKAPSELKIKFDFIDVTTVGNY